MQGDIQRIERLWPWHRRGGLRRWLWVFVLIALVGKWGGERWRDYALRGDSGVTVNEVDQNGTITLQARLTTCSAATITLAASLQNMVASRPLPLTVDVAARGTSSLVTLTVVDPSRPWRYDYRYVWRAGARRTGQPKDYRYALPFRGGPFRVLQGPHGSFSHYEGTGCEEAIDWAMPVGTPVYPARAGEVVGIRQDCDRGGPDRRYIDCFNYVIVRHDDGTFADYMHLKHNGVLVRLGDRVKPTRPIAYSGETGYTMAPSLHFVVYNTLSGARRITWPVTFASSQERALMAVAGDRKGTDSRTTTR